MSTLHRILAVLPDQCGSSLVQTIDAPPHLVWSVVRRFSNPQAYKKFVRTCTLSSGDGDVAGSVRELTLVSGLPARTSTERLDCLDDESHVMAFSVIGGDNRLVNYRSTLSLKGGDGDVNGGKTVVTESYEVDVPADNSREDTCSFAETIIGCNLRCLAKVAEKMASGI